MKKRLSFFIASCSDSRKYPAIHPLDSWSKYDGIIEKNKINVVHNILYRSNEVNQMMKVVGEEGTSAKDYIVYQKGEFLDSVYLQQNSFDPIDAAVTPERQIYTFNLLYQILTSDYDLNDKKEIRNFFNKLRQEFLDWNNTEWNSIQFKIHENNLKELYTSVREN